MTAPTVDPVCLCGDPKSEHRLGRKGCKALDCGCGEFEPAEGVSPGIADLAAEVLGGKSTSARLREVERELADVTGQLSEARAEAAGAAGLLGRIEKAAGAEESDPFTDLADFVGRVRRERDSLARRLAVRFEEKTKAEEARDMAQAKLDNALRQMAEKVAAEQGRVAELEALLEHAEQHARDLQGNGDVPPVEIHGWDAFQCFTCGSRYRIPFDHEHPLTPVRVSITERQEHHPL